MGVCHFHDWNRDSTVSMRRVWRWHVVGWNRDRTIPRSTSCRMEICYPMGWNGNSTKATTTYTRTRMGVWMFQTGSQGCYVVAVGGDASLNMNITDSSSIHITMATSLNLVIVRVYLMAFAVLGPFLVQDLLPAWVHSNQTLFIVLSSDIPVCVCVWVGGWEWEREREREREREGGSINTVSFLRVWLWVMAEVYNGKWWVGPE